MKLLATNLGLYLSSAIESEFLLEDPFTTYRFASWRKVSENPSVIFYGLDLTVNGFFSERRFRRVYCFLAGARITFYKMVKKSSPKDVRVLVILLLLSSESVTGAELEEGISEIEGVQEGSLGILNLKGKMFSK